MPRPADQVRRVIKAYDVRGLVGVDIDEGFVADVGAAFARMLRQENAGAAGPVVIGHDMRDSSPGLADSFAGGVTGQGLDVVRIGLASTDQLYFASGLLNCPGAMFTASHNPAAYNGIKLCRAQAKPVGSDTGLALISEELIDGVPAYDGAREGSAIRMCWPTTPHSCGRLSTSAHCDQCGWPLTPAMGWPATPPRRCWQRFRA